jgi:NADPH:quinone reductase-like Zn-dependent oxidoreductase
VENAPRPIQIQLVKRQLPWERLGAVPEMLQTSWRSLFRALRLQKGERLLIRGGTTSGELPATVTAKEYGAVVASTLRRADRADLPGSAGADRVEIRFMSNNWGFVLRSSAPESMTWDPPLR